MRKRFAIVLLALGLSLQLLFVSVGQAATETEATTTQEVVSEHDGKNSCPFGGHP